MASLLPGLRWTRFPPRSVISFSLLAQVLLQHATEEEVSIRYRITWYGPMHYKTKVFTIKLASVKKFLQAMG